MKLITFILAALMSNLCAALAQDNMVPRALDPATMNPTQLSVLSVLKTALSGVSLPPAPTATDMPDPEWFANLPADIKSLLPELYPIAVAAVETAPTPSSVEMGIATAPPSSSVELGIATAPGLSDILDTNATSTAAVTVTKSLQHAPSVTGTGDLGPTSNGTLTTHLPPASPTSSVSGGASIKGEMQILVAAMWVGVAAGFCLFA